MRASVSVLVLFIAPRLLIGRESSELTTLSTTQVSIWLGIKESVVNHEDHAIFCAVHTTSAEGIFMR